MSSLILLAGFTAIIVPIFLLRFNVPPPSWHRVAQTAGLFMIALGFLLKSRKWSIQKSQKEKPAERPLEKE